MLQKVLRIGIKLKPYTQHYANYIHISGIKGTEVTEKQDFHWRINPHLYPNPHHPFPFHSFPFPQPLQTTRPLGQYLGLWWHSLSIPYSLGCIFPSRLLGVMLLELWCLRWDKAMPMWGRAGFRLCFGSFCFISVSQRTGACLECTAFCLWCCALPDERRGSERRRQAAVGFSSHPGLPVSGPVMPWPHVRCASGGAGSSANLLWMNPNYIQWRFLTS